MRRVTAAVIVVACGVAAGCQPEQQPQRFEAHTGYASSFNQRPGADAMPVTLLVDKQTGKTWMLRNDAGGQPGWYFVDSEFVMK